MRYNRLGNTGLFVSELCLGTMTFGGGHEGIYGVIGNVQQGEADAQLRAAIDAGINFIDTANSYAGGRSEEITGQAIRNLGLGRDDFVLATKVFSEMGPGVNSAGASRFHIMESVKESLRRLQLGHIDLYQIHGLDPATPVEETLRALDTLAQQGLVRYIGVSNWAAWQISRALGISERLGLARFECLQAYYTIAGRDLEREIVPMLGCERLGLMVWSPLAGGLLSGKYQEKGVDGRRIGFDFPPVDRDLADAAIDAMRVIAQQRGVSIARIALAWLLHQPAVTSVIIGARHRDQLDDNIAAAKIVLSDEDLATLDAVSALPPTYPGWMYPLQGVRRIDQLAKSKS